MELLVVTLAQVMPDRDAEGLARIHLISDTIRNALGLVSASFYRSRGNEAYYFMLTTWEDEECWQKARERYNPKQLLMGSAAGLLIHPPEQWLMHYLWGYSRPAAQPILATVQLGTILPDQADRAQRGWIECLGRQAVQPILSFAFLARGLNEDMKVPHAFPAISAAGGGHSPYKRGSIFLNLLSWASQADREDFYADQYYQAISRFLNRVGAVQVITLEPL